MKPAHRLVKSEASTGTQAVDRATDLVALVVRASTPLSFSEIQSISGLARSTTSRLLSALERQGMLARTSSGSFVPGALFVAYAATDSPEAALVRLARPAMESLSRLTGETVNLAIAKGADVVQVAQVDSRFVLGSREWVGVDVPAHCSALGKILYAFEALPMAREPLAAPTPHTVASVADLTEQCTQARRRGYATAVDELEIGLCAVAVPILGGRGRALAALGVSGPADRLVDQFDRVAELLRQHSAVVAKRLSTHHKEGAA